MTGPGERSVEAAEVVHKIDDVDRDLALALRKVIAGE